MNKKTIIIIVLLFIIVENFLWGVKIGPILFKGFQIHKEFPADIKISDVSFEENNILNVKYSVGTKYPFGERSTLYDVVPVVIVYSDYKCRNLIGGSKDNKTLQIKFPQRLFVESTLFLEKKYNKLSVRITADGKYSPTYKGSSECVTVDLTGFDGLCSNKLYSTEFHDFGNDGEMIWLTPESFSKLELELENKGNSALDDIKDLTCIESLNLRGSAMTDISRLSSLKNMKYLGIPTMEMADSEVLKDMPKLEKIVFKFKVIPNEQKCSELISLFPDVEIHECEDFK